MSPDDKKSGNQPGTPGQAAPHEPFFGDGDFEEIDALQPFEGEGARGGETRVVSMASISSIASDVQRAARAGVSIAGALIEPLPARQTVILEFKAGAPPVVVGKSVTVIGRAQGVADVVVPDDGQVSRQHAALIYAKGDFFLEDLQSSNGTFVDGQRIKSVKLEPLQQFRIGSYTARIRLKAN